MAGEEIVQVYVNVPGFKVGRHKKVLKGFKKVHLNPGEVKEVIIDVPLKELEYFDEKSESWILENTDYVFMVGPSSDESFLLQSKIHCVV